MTVSQQMSRDLAQRLDALEMRIAHQDREIEELNAVVSGQWREIERLKRELMRLDDRFAEMEVSAREGQRAEPPPPHY
jgi:SlyX protein